MKARLYHFLAPLVALAVVGLINQNSLLLYRLEALTANLRFQARAPFDPPADPRLVFVGIDQASLDRLGTWPWPRNVEADFIKAIALAGVNPHTVTYDVLFSEESDKLKNFQTKNGENYDQTLADAIGLLPSVITGAHLQSKFEEADDEKAAKETATKAMADLGETAPLTHIQGDTSTIHHSDTAIFPVLPIRKQSLFGFVNAEASSVDDIRHTVPMVVRVQDKFFPSLALQTLCQMLNIDADKVEINVGKWIKLKNSSGKTWTIPIDETGEMAVNYRNQDRFGGLSFYKVLTAMLQHVQDNTPIPSECDLSNKTVLVGGYAVGVEDMGPTPLQAKSFLPYVHLNVINNVLHNDYLKLVPWYWVVACWLPVTWITLFRLKEASLAEAIIAPFGIVVLYTGIAFGIFALWSVQIALAWPVISYGVVNFGGVVLRWREEQRGREQIKQVFSQMLSPEVMGHLLDHSENLQLGGSKRAVTILFSDIRDYTKFSEGLEEVELVRQLNVYFTRMVACVKECRGTLHKFIGDAIMSVWGDIATASQGAEKDAQNAVRSALMMRGRLRELNEERTAAKLTPIRIGIGLNHGEVLVGLIGATSRSEFTVMGDAVNVASRLEGITKEFQTDLAISDSVRKLLGGDFLVRRLGFIQLKGKTQATVVYEVLAEKTDLAHSKMSTEMVAVYEKAFDDFLARRFSEAETGFLLCRKSYPDDFCANQYLTASREFLAEPPPPNWDGRIVMKTK